MIERVTPCAGHMSSREDREQRRASPVELLLVAKSKRATLSDAPVSYPRHDVRASHVNADHRQSEGRKRPKCQGFRPPPAEVVVEPAPVTPFGGLALGLN